MSACEDLRCTYNCRITPDGPLCYCGPGQQANGSHCVDFNECTLEDTCDQICVNTVGSYICKCAAGYTRIDGRCQAIDVPNGAKPALLLLTLHDIGRVAIKPSLNESNIDLERSKTLLVIEDPVTLEMWHQNESICVISITRNKTTEFNCHDFKNPSNKRKMPAPDLFANMDSIDQLALDWVSGNWYFLDDQKEIIFVCSPLMEHCTIILENNIGKPRGMALDPTKGYIFYTKWGHSLASLDKANLDGTEAGSIVTDKIVYPHGITLDLAMQHVYWVDTYMDNVERVDYNGGKRWSLKKKSQFLSVAQSLHSIAIFEDTLYFASWKNQSLIAVNKFTSEAKILQNGVNRGTSLHIYHRQKQPNVIHPCREENGGCEHLCISMYENNTPVAQCVCSPGYRQENNNKCVLIREKAFLLFVKENPAMIKGIPITAQRMVSGADNQTIVPVTNIGWPVCFDFNVRDKLIYFANTGADMVQQSQTFMIESQTFDGKNRKVLIDGLKSISGLAFDWMAYNIFFTNSDSNSVSVLKLSNTTIRKVLVKETYHPMSITLDPRNGYMYWSTWATVHQSTGLIERAYLDGTNRTTFVKATDRHLHWPTSLSIDFNENKLYWCDPVTPGIERINLDGTNRELLYEGAENQFYPMSSVYYNDYIFWTDNVKGGIMKMKLAIALKDPSSEKYITLSEEKPLIYDMKIFDQNVKIDVNVCSSNDTCPGLCLFTPEGAKCHCGDGYEFNASGTKCIEITNYSEKKVCSKGKSQLFSNLFISMQFIPKGFIVYK